MPLRPLFPLALATLLAVPPATAAEGALAGLYAPRPPAGSAFVRVASPVSIQARVGQGEPQRIGEDRAATRYAVIDAARPFAVEIDGATTELQVEPGSFTTLVHEPSAATLARIADDGPAPDALKAELRFYNLAPGCAEASLAIAPDGPELFGAVPPHATRARAVNPVQATLQASCDGVRSEPLALPTLAPGDRYGLFLTRADGQPRLTGQLAETDPVPAR